MEIRDLVARASAREEQAWETIVRQYGPLIWRLLQKFRNLEKEALDDLFQDVFTVLLNGGTQELSGIFRTRVPRVPQSRSPRMRPGVACENTAASSKSSNNRRTPPKAATSWALLTFSPILRQDPRSRRSALEIRTKLSGCIQQILQIDQEIFWMRERGLAYKEITETLGLPHGTVASKYHRAKEALADCLEKAGITGVREK